MPLFLLMATVAVGLLSAGDGHAAEKEEIRRENLTLLFDEPLREATGEVAALYPSVAAEIRDTLGMPADFGHTVVLMKDRQEFESAVGGSGIILAAAFPGRDLIVLDYGRVVEKPYALRGTLLHELCHLALDKHVSEPNIRSGRPDPLVRWLNEGVCQWASGGVSELEQVGKPSELTNAALFGGIIPLPRLERDFPAGEKGMALAYEQSRSVVEYIARRYGRRGLLKVLDRLREGYMIDGAILGGLGVTYGELEKGWHAELKKRHTWLVWTSNNIQMLLFALAGLILLMGFLRAMWRIYTYRDEEDEEETRGFRSRAARPRRPFRGRRPPE